LITFSVVQQPLVDHSLLIIELSRSHSDTTLRYDSPGRKITPIQRPLQITRDVHNRAKSVPPSGFERTIPGSLRQQTCASDAQPLGSE